MATRDAGGAVINALAGIVTNLVGGSADLDPSTRTAMTGCGDFESPLGAQAGDACRPRAPPAACGGTPAGTFTSGFASTPWPPR